MQHYDCYLALFHTYTFNKFSNIFFRLTNELLIKMWSLKYYNISIPNENTKHNNIVLLKSETYFPSIFQIVIEIRKND